MSISSSKIIFMVAVIIVTSFVFCPSILAEKKIVKASSFGFDPQNATECLQKAINSGATTVIVDNVGKDWIIDPVFLASNQEIIFSKNVTVKAREGSFKGLKDALFSSHGGKNIILRGEDNVLFEMNKKDYQNKALYKHSEWRHILNLLSCQNVKIKNLTLSSSGGDGIYLGRLWGKKNIPAYCKNILIENVKAVNNHRQGISVISAEDIMVRNSAFNNTSGTPPQSGVDIEPNSSGDRLINCVFENCLFEGNTGAGIEVNLNHSNKESHPASIVFKDCKAYDNRSVNILVSNTKGVRGNIQFIDSSAKGKIMIVNLGQNFSTTFSKCVVNNITGRSAFVITSEFDNMGKVDFQSVDVFDDNGYLPIEIKSRNGHFVKNLNISGTLKYNNAPYNLKDFEDKHTKEISRFDNLENAVVDLKNIKGETATASTTPGRFNIRNNACFLQYCQKGKETGIILTPIAIKRPGKKKIEVSVFDPDDRMINSIQLSPNAKPFTLKFIPEMTGIYQLKFKPKRQLLGIKSKSHGQCGFLISDRLQMIRPLGNLYFEVPRGVAKFDLVLSGDPGESLTASLLDPAGKVVQKKENFDVSTIFTGHRSNTDQSEVWSIRLEKSKEDVFVKLCKPLIPIIATDPALLLRVK